MAPRRTEEKKLTGNDYMSKSIQDLVEHPDFSQHAYRVMIAISKMTSAQIEQINLNPSGRAN